MAEQLIIRIKLHHGQPDHGQQDHEQKKSEQPQPNKGVNNEDIKPLIAKIAAAIIAVVAIILTLLPGGETTSTQQVTEQNSKTTTAENNKAITIKSNNAQNISSLNSGRSQVKPVTPVARKKPLPASKPIPTQEMANAEELSKAQTKLQKPQKNLSSRPAPITNPTITQAQSKSLTPPSQTPSPTPNPSLPTNPADIAGQFTSGIKRLKPIDDLGTQIKPIAGKFTRSIYYYTIIKNQKGKKLTHKWEQNGKQRASISSQITQNRQIMYSSKKITTNMTGEWKVSVIDEAGNILKVDRFNY